jgi:RimJ/RimL family protein N-acetyltransferase
MSLASITLRTKRLVLRELALSDAPAANAYERDLDVVHYTGHGPLTLGESEARIQRSVDAAAAQPRRVFDFAITRASDGAFIGRTGFATKEPDHQQAMLWYILHKSAWGSGIAAEAARAACDFGFNELGLRRIWADIDPRNAGSVRVAEKLGLRREAFMIESMRVKGYWTDALIFAALRHEWT